MAKQWDKSKMPSRHVTLGPTRAPHRSYYYAMGDDGGGDRPAAGWRRHLLE